MSRIYGLQAYYLVGRFPDNSIWLQPLLDTVPTMLGFWESLALIRLCERAGSVAVCTIRVTSENNRLIYYHGYFNEPPSTEDKLAKDNALLRIVADGTLSPNNPRAAENLIADVKLAQSLGINMKREQR